MMDSASLIAQLQTEIAARLAPVDSAPGFALLDFPDHANVGDSAIWAGEIAFFRKVRRSAPDYVCSFRNLDLAQLEAACPDGPVFIHGGGNFGDIWLHHHEFRLGLLDALRGRKLVQLPQSIHFGSEARAAETARAIERHGDFTLYVRDAESLEFARSRFPCEVVLCPDMAFCIGPLDRGAARYDVLALLRTDSERVSATHPLSGEPGVQVADWMDENVNLVRAAKALGYLKALPSGAVLGRRAAYELASWRRIRRGCRLLSSGATVLTDRLHAHILSLLLGAPHAVLDNSYGKIARFSKCWTERSDLFFRAESYSQALSWCRSQVAASGAAVEG